MKISPSAIRVIIGLLAVDATTSFVQNNIGTITAQKIPASAATKTSLFASDVDTEASTSSKFPFSDRQVRYAYDEWRLIYGKGDFDQKRFESFKSNHRTLVMSNLKARDKAVQDGRPMPQWMSLNEYGDYSMEEYEAMMRGDDPRADESTKYSAKSSGEQQIRGTQVVTGDDYSTNYNNGQVTEYQDAFGRTIRSTQAVGQDTPLGTATVSVNSNYANNIDEYDPSRGTLIIPKDESGTQVVGSGARGTQVIGSGGGAQRGTQVIGTNGEAQRGTQAVATSAGARGTQVVGSSNGAMRGTQVVNGNGMTGTRAVSTSGVGASYGTQVINGGDGTPVISAAGDDDGDFDFDSTAGTQIIPKNQEGTQIIPKDQGGTQPVTKSESDFANFVTNDDNKATQAVSKDQGGTQVVSSESTGTQQVVAPTDSTGTQVMGGTMPVEKNEEDALAKVFGVLFGDGKKNEETQKVDDSDGRDADQIGKRGTMVIKRSFNVPEQKKPRSLFDILFSDPEEKKEGDEESTKKESTEKPSEGIDLFGFLSPKEEDTAAPGTATKVIKAEEENDLIGDIFSFLSPKEEETKATGTATQVIKAEKESDVLGDIFSFLSPKEEPVVVEPATKATEVEEETPTGSGIFSLFGGNVQSSNPRPVRTSISLQKQTPKPKPSTNAQSQRKTKLIPDQTEQETGIPSILSFFGGAKKVDEEDAVRNSKSRPTLILKKPKTNQFTSLFSNKKSEESPAPSTSSKTTNKNPVIAEQIARRKAVLQKAAEDAKNLRQIRFQERQEKRAEATKRREAAAKRGTKMISKPVTPAEPKPAPSPFAFFGAIGKKAEPPTLKNWKQNRDGTISGLIYDSKNFEDGTRITTSPIPRGAKKGETVKTAGGSQYSLE